MFRHWPFTLNKISTGALLTGPVSREKYKKAVCLMYLISIVTSTYLEKGFSQASGFATKEKQQK